LGGVSSEYRVNAYGEMSGPLHRGTPTDRLVIEWWPHRATGANQQPPFEHTDVPAVISTAPSDAWIESRAVNTNLDAPQLQIQVPPRFGEMQQQSTDRALAWRLATRQAFTHYFARGYRAVGFTLDRTSGGGAYLLRKVQTQDSKLQTSV